MEKSLCLSFSEAARLPHQGLRVPGDRTAGSSIPQLFAFKNNALRAALFLGRLVKANAGADFAACEHAYPHNSPQALGVSFFIN
jgi:hypothetical protein